jgi:hypothetical protein
MYDHDQKDMVSTLANMRRVAVERSNFDQVAAAERLKGYVAQDARFAGYDKDRLVKRVEDCRDTGAVLDLDDPYLRSGGQTRPLDRGTYGNPRNRRF